MDTKDLNLDQWNERLDKNLEKPSESSPDADENAEEFSEHYGTDRLRSQQGEITEFEDHLKASQPKPGSPQPGEIEREE